MARLGDDKCCKGVENCCTPIAGGNLSGVTTLGNGCGSSKD